MIETIFDTLNCKAAIIAIKDYLNDNDLTGEIPSSINNLQNLERLRLQNNNLFGYLPDEICSIELDWDDQSSFNITGNNLCSELPYCIDGNQGEQNTSNCENVSIEGRIPPYKYGIKGAFPNPFNPSMNIEINVNPSTELKVDIFSYNGNHAANIFDGITINQLYQFRWEPKNISSAVYFVRLIINGRTKYKKVTFIK